MMALLRFRGTFPYFKQRAHFFAVVGAIIVFFTFVVKEQLGERWRRTSESIESAETMYLIQTSTQGQSVAIQELQVTLGNMQSYNHEGDFFDAKHLELMNDSTPLMFADRELRAKLESIRSYIDKLPENDALKEQLQYFVTAEQNWREAFEKENYKWTDEADKELGPFPKPSAAAVPDAQWKKDRYLVLSTFNERLPDTYRLDLAVKTKSEEIIKRNKTKASWAAWFSGGLYLFGWALGLAGKIAGEDFVPIG